jgi:hypothetical protein
MNLFKWKNMPVLLSSTKENSSADIFYDFDLFLDEETGLVKQKSIPPQDILYKEARNSGIGKTWENHYESFYQFIVKNINLKNKKICEIGYVLLNGAAYHDEIKNNLIEKGFKVID